VYTTILWTKIGLGVSAAVVAAALVWLSLFIAIRSSRGLAGFVFQDPTGATRLEIGPIVTRVVPAVALLIGAVVGFSASEHWDTLLRWMHASQFGERDPVLGYEVGFYVFELPAWETLASGLLTVLGLALVATAALYFARGGIVFTGRGVRAERGPRIHLSMLGALILVLLAVQAWLAMPNLMYSDLGPVSGASYADVNARLPALQGQVALTLVAAVLVAVSAFRKRMILAIAGAALYVAVELLGVTLYPAIIHRFTVVPNEAVKEAPYIQHNIEATRAAYGLGSVTERELTTEERLTRADIDENRATIDNIRLWDHEQLLDTFAQIQEIRTYYEFTSVDNDRYMIDGQLRQTMLSPRELKTELLPNRTWINEHFTFTHGYGITLGPVNTATNEGLPQLFIQDLPPTSDIELDVTRPEIYFGELSNEYVLVKTRNREFDYPQGEENVYSSYEGTGGIPLDSTLFIAAAAIRLAQFKLLLSDDITDESRMLLYRNVRERVRRIAPFLRLDRDPYMIVREDGSLVWIQDAYTVSRRYPYSQPSDSPTLGRLNYVRNSVKVVVDAYHGSVDLYINDPDDPVLATWRRIFPGTFTPIDEMPEDIRDHLRYPEDIFRVQTERFAIYHMDRAELVYNQEDRWEIPSIRRAETAGSQMVPYYTIMKLPGGDHEEFIQMIPFTPASKQNLAAWMVARSDRAHLGELVVYRFPKDRLVFGPQQVMNRIDQEEDISRQISLWDQRGSEAILGTMLVIPVEESLLYVVPLYLRAQGGRIPELKRVIVVYENNIAMEPTLDAAMETLFGPSEAAAEVAIVEPAPDAEPAEPVDGEEPTAPAAAATPTLAAEANDRYQRAVAAQRRGDWAAYGEELEQLGAILERLAAERQ
jgi:uncharacterized membrane protein (UPF0182 family)